MGYLNTYPNSVFSRLLETRLLVRPRLRARLASWGIRSGSGRFVRLNDQPLTDNTYSDGAVRAGRQYQYAVTAVDRGAPPNESEMSGGQAVYTAP